MPGQTVENLFFFFLEPQLVVWLPAWNEVASCSGLLGYTTVLPRPLDAPILTDRLWVQGLKFGGANSFPFSPFSSFDNQDLYQFLGKHIRYIPPLISKLIEVSRVAVKKVKAGSDSLIHLRCYCHALDPSDKVMKRCQYVSLLL